MTAIDLPSEWEITLDEPDEKQAIIPDPEAREPTAIVSFEEFEGEYYVNLFHHSIKPKMDQLIGRVDRERFDSKDAAFGCFEQFARNYREMLPSN